jgi:hypothetical protein
MTAKNSFSTERAARLAGTCLGILSLLLLAGCADSPPWGTWSKAPSQQQIAAVLRRPNTYIYFSNYQIYHNPARSEYVFWDGKTWVTSPQPPEELSAELLRDSPAVALELRDHPAKTHAEVVRRYPRDWRSPDSYVAAMQ